jgi:hypothetical protein
MVIVSDLAATSPNRITPRDRDMASAAGRIAYGLVGELYKVSLNASKLTGEHGGKALIEK